MRKRSPSFISASEFLSFAYFGVDSAFRLYHCRQTAWENFTHELPKKARRTHFFMGFEEMFNRKVGKKLSKLS